LPAHLFELVDEVEEERRREEGGGMRRMRQRRYSRQVVSQNCVSHLDEDRYWAAKGCSR
jgi:hypothetical protein